MPVSHASTDVVQRIQHLLDERQTHAEAITTIDATLARVGAALTSNGHAHKQISVPATIPTAARKKRQGRGKFAVSANDFVLAFVKANKNPTTQDIKKHWTSEGRRGTPDNTLSLLTKAKQLKRNPLGKGIRGSRYSLA